MKRRELHVENRPGVAFVKMLQRIRVQLPLIIRHRLENMLRLHLFYHIILAIFHRLLLNLREVLFLNILHKEIRVTVPFHPMRAHILELREGFRAPHSHPTERPIYHRLENMPRFRADYKASFILHGMRNTEPAPGDDFILALPKERESFGWILEFLWEIPDEDFPVRS